MATISTGKCSSKTPGRFASRGCVSRFYRTRSKVPAAPPKLVERVLGSGVFDRWESWELLRLRRKLAPLLGEAAEVVCSPDQCKGHTGLHRSSVLTRFADRLKQVAIYNSFADLLEHTERIQKPDA